MAHPLRNGGQEDILIEFINRLRLVNNSHLPQTPQPPMSTTDEMSYIAGGSRMENLPRRNVMIDNHHGNYGNRILSPFLFAPRPVGLPRPIFQGFGYGFPEHANGHRGFMPDQDGGRSVAPTPSPLNLGHNHSLPPLPPPINLPVAATNYMPVPNIAAYQTREAASSTVDHNHFHQVNLSDYAPPSRNPFHGSSPFQKAPAPPPLSPTNITYPQSQRYNSASPSFGWRNGDAHSKILITPEGINVVSEGRQGASINQVLLATNSGNHGGRDPLAFLKEMMPGARHEYLQKCSVEISVILKSQEDEDAEVRAEHFEKEKETNKFQIHSKTVGSTTRPFNHPLISIIKSLPPYVLASTQRLTVTLTFPKLLTTNPPTGPAASSQLPPRNRFTLGNSTHGIPSSPSAYTSTPNFRLCAHLAHHINEFSGLTNLEIIIAPPANMRTPMTIPQLNCFLPFYDLEYTAWEAKWQTGFMSRSEHLKGWPVGYLNWEREKILGERLQRARREKAESEYVLQKVANSKHDI